MCVCSLLSAFARVHVRQCLVACTIYAAGICQHTQLFVYCSRWPVCTFTGAYILRIYGITCILQSYYLYAGVLLGYNLTEMPLMQSHIEAILIQDLPSEHLKDYVC